MVRKSDYEMEEAMDHGGESSEVDHRKIDRCGEVPAREKKER